MSLLNIWGHIATVPACGSGTLTNVLPHRNAMPHTQDMTPHPVTVYRHRADLSLCYPLMWNVTPEYTITTTHFNVLGKNPIGISFPDLPHTPANAQLCDAVPYLPGLEPGTLWCTNPSRYPLAHSCFFSGSVHSHCSVVLFLVSDKFRKCDVSRWLLYISNDFIYSL